MKSESKNAKNLHLGRKFSYDCNKAYHSRFLDKKTSKFFTNLTKMRNCPVCDSAKYTHVLDKSGGSYVKCVKCTMIFLNPVFKKNFLDKYYRDLDTGQAIIVENESSFYKEIYLKGLNKISKTINKGKILDVGCSSGVFLDIAKRRGWETFGIEPMKLEAEMCKNKGHTLYTKKLDDLKIDLKFDVITLWDVFEHLPDGKEQLKLFKSKLSPKGVIFMQIPNSDALAPRIMHERCNMFDGIEHVNLYNPRTIKLIAQNVGLKIKELRTVISEIAVLNNYLNYEDPYFGDSDFGDKLLDILNGDFLHKNLMGYKMQIIMERE